MSDEMPEAATAAASAVLARLEPAAAEVVGAAEPGLDERVSRLVAPLGPADQTAFHDFDHIEFAFESVWTELYDRDFVRKVAELWTTIGRVRRYAGYDADDPELANWIEDLDGRLDDIEAEAAEAELVDDPSYGVVVAVFPTMSPGLWAWIGPVERSRFFKFALEYRTRSAGPTAEDKGIVGEVLEDATGFVEDAVDGVVDFAEDVVDTVFGWF